MRNSLKKFRIIAVCGLICFTAFTACSRQEESAAPAAGQEAAPAYPTREITVIVGSGAGGGLDNFARAISTPVSEILGVPLVVVNVQGGAGSVGFAQVMEQEADGYTIFAIGTDILLNDLFQKNEYKHTSLVPIARAQNDQSVFWVAKDSRFKTMQDVVDYAKANPGKLSFGMVGAQGIDMVVIERWAQLADVEVTPVPLANGSEMMAGLVGGHVDICHEEPGAAMAMFEAGEIRPLLVMTEERLARFPDTPTAREMGADVTIGNWRGAFVKEGTPQELVAQLQAAFQKGLQDSRYKEFEKAQLLDLREGYMSSSDFKTFIADQYKVYEDIVKSIGLVQ